MSNTIPTESGAGVLAGIGKPFRVKIRRPFGGHRVKPEAEQIDGNIYIFREGWTIDKFDSSIYIGEMAMIPNDYDWPADAPGWVSSGDLELI